jgi:hypothetical protein
LAAGAEGRGEPRRDRAALAAAIDAHGSALPPARWPRHGIWRAKLAPRGAKTI